MIECQRTDIGAVAAELDRLAALGEFMPTTEARDFILRHAALLAALLHERMQESDAASGGQRLVVEGFSDIDAQDALAHALSKASRFFSEHQDVSLTLQELNALPHGGHHAVVEVHITPLSLHVTPHIVEPDIADARANEFAVRMRRKRAAELPAHMIYDHFAMVKKAVPGMPASFMINITDAGLLNNMIEKQFFKSTHPAPFPAPAPSDQPTHKPTPAQPLRLLFHTIIPHPSP